MDNNGLDDLLNDRRERHFWLKPIGLPGVPMQRIEEWPEPEVEIVFVHHVNDIADGDILIAYRTGLSRLIYVAERLPESQRTTPRENRSEENRLRYPFAIKARNLTPEYGACWSEFNHRPFTLANELNPLHPEDPAQLGRLQHHSDRAPVPRWFAERLIGRIRESVRS